MVINHTAVRSDVGADRVASAQRQRWPGIVSQFFITGDGKIQRTNPDLEVVSRDQAWIFNGLNIYVAGNFDSAVPSDAQLDALAQLCAWLVDQYGLKPDAIKGVSEFIQTHSPGLQWLEGERWKDKLLGQVTKLIGSTAPGDATVAELKAEIERLKTQVQTLQSQNKTLSDQVTSLTNANTALKAQVVAAAAEKQALEKRITELEPRIAELTKTGQAQPPAIRDITASLPTHATARYDKRTTAAITTLAIHHSAAAGDIAPRTSPPTTSARAGRASATTSTSPATARSTSAIPWRRFPTMLATQILIQWASAWQAVLWAALSRPRSSLPLLRTLLRTCQGS